MTRISSTRWEKRLAFCVLLGLAALPGTAGVIFSDIGASPGFTQSSGVFITGSTPAAPPGAGVSAVSGQTIAQPFTSLGDYTLGDVEVALGLWAGTDSVNVYLDADSGGVPGAVLESWTATNLAPFLYPDSAGGGALVTLDSVLNPELQAGAEYFIVVQAGASDTAAVWMQNDDSYQSPQSLQEEVNYSASSTGPWAAFPYCCTPAFEVDSATGASTPEPGTAWTGLAGLTIAAACGLARYRRAGSATSESVCR